MTSLHESSCKSHKNSIVRWIFNIIQASFLSAEKCIEERRLFPPSCSYSSTPIEMMLRNKKKCNFENNALTIRFWLFGCSCVSSVTAIKKKPVALLMIYIPHTGRNCLEPMESRIQKTGSRRILWRPKTMENLHMPSNSESTMA